MFNYALISIFALIGLIIINLIWEIFYHPMREEGSWLVIKSAILLLPLKGIMQKKNVYLPMVRYADYAFFH